MHSVLIKGGVLIRELYFCCITHIQDQVSKLEERNKVLEGDLETLRQATGKDEREKADIISAEKKVRAQVRNSVVHVSLCCRHL